MGTERNGGRAVTLRQVAERAGVSKSTAAIVLSGRAVACRISAPCAERVRAAAQLLGYQGNYHARTLSTGRAATLGLTVGEGGHRGVASSFWGAIADGVAAAARGRGYDLLLLGGSGGDAAIAHAASRLETRRVDALIVLRQLFYRLPDELLNTRRPVVTIGGQQGEGFPDVRLDAAPGIAAAVSHLAGLGHRVALWLAHERDGEVVLPERRAAFLAAARRHRMAVRETAIPAFDSQGMSLEQVVARYQVQLRALALPKGVTAVFCYNDLMALAAQGVLRERGLGLPDALALIGFDDLHAELAAPPLSTISHGLHELGAAAVALAVDLAEGGRPPPLTLVPARFVARASTVTPPGGQRVPVVSGG